MVKYLKYHLTIIRMYYNIWFKRKKRKPNQLYIYEQRKDK
jgi:hypothetical protein